MASDLAPAASSETPHTNTNGYTPVALDAEEIEAQFRGLLLQGSAGKLPSEELALRILSLIQQWVASAKDEAKSDDNDTPGVETMGWMLWGMVDSLAREDVRHHDALVGFINAFFPLLQPQPWRLWGDSIRDTDFLLGATFRESLQGAEPDAQLPGVRSWCNYCRFVARMTRDTAQDFSLYLLWFAREALEDCTWCPCQNPDAAVVALEGVVDVCGARMVELETEFGAAGDGGDGKRSWTGKSGFCEERWLFWEAELMVVANDEVRRCVGVRECARRIAGKMRAIREEHLESTRRALNSSA